MDSNAHSVVFGAAKQGPRGDLLEDFLARYGYVPLNVGNEPTHVTTAKEDGGRGVKTVIDVSFCSPELAQCISDWRVHRSNIFDCDHRLIQMKVEMSNPIYHFTRCFKNTNWDKFRCIINDDL